MNPSTKQLRNKFHKLRSDGKIIVFTNGCFDLLHKGHLDLLKKSSKLGNYIIVGLNSDKSVKLIKGNNRPIDNQTIRYNKLKDLDFIDEVIIFNNRTPSSLIKIIKPHFLVKGADYQKEKISGFKDVSSWGGQVKLIELTPGYSTTSIIKQIRR